MLYFNQNMFIYGLKNFTSDQIKTRIFLSIG